MKRNLYKLYLVILIAALNLANLSGQVSNAGFEQWEPNGNGYLLPGWITVFNEPDNPTVLPSNDAYSGSWSCLLKASFSSFYNEVIIPLIETEPRFPLTGRPANLTFYLKGTSVGGDSLLVSTSLFDQEMNTVASAVTPVFPESGWTKMTIPLTYYTGAQVSEGVLLFSGLPQPHEGTGFYIDEVAYSGSTGGSEEGQWIRIPAPTEVDLNDVRFAGNDNGWIVGNAGTALKSVDGGQNWTLPDPVSLFDMRALWTFNDGRVIATAWDTVYLSSDQGGSWTPLPTSGTNIYINDIHFIDDAGGWIAGEWSFVAHSGDGGGSWTGGSTVSGEEFRSVFFTSAETGYAAGTGGLLSITRDGGAEWKDTLMGDGMAFNSIFFNGEENGWIAGDAATLLKTVNGGANWEALTLPDIGVESNLNDIFFLDPSLGWICGSGGLILRTTDGGMNWTREFPETTNNLFAIYFSDPDHGWSVGAEGTILRYNPDASGIGAFQEHHEYMTRIFPNPCTGRFTLTLDLPEKADITIRIFDITGKTVGDIKRQEYLPGEHTLEFDLTEAPAGIYFLMAGSDRGYRENRKLIISK